ncbi:hypothetical protein [uncultured Pontibacter sp.]|uniref:hypothetical protein n=1 Tax=uncultured Pontibacter sp. TaxID=453356 RepID=UPI00261775E7|nr:hypothetical protein [uncultured Pontibacter sp.]
MNTKEYKYNLNKLLMETERGLAISTIEKMVTKEYGIPAPTFRKDRAIEKGSSKSIKDDRLACYAAFFNTTTDKLRNYELASNKSLKQLKSQTTKDVKEAVSDAIGLTKRA